MEKSKKSNIIFFGTSDIAVPALRSLASDKKFFVALVVSQSGKKHPSKKQTNSPVAECASAHGLPIITPTSSRDKTLEDALVQIHPDVCVLMAYGSIIPDNLLSIPTHGWINIHPSLLPQYRGPSPIQSALLAGEHETGVTIIAMDAGVDTGPILESRSFPILPYDTNMSLSKKASEVAATLIRSSLAGYLSGTLKPQAQPTVSPTPLTKKISKDDAHLDFHKPAEELERRIRAFTPWPGTDISYEQEKIKIHKARVVDNAERLAGGEISNKNGMLVIGAGNHSALQILKLQRPGKKPLSAVEFLRGYSSFGSHPLQ